MLDKFSCHLILQNKYNSPNSGVAFISGCFKMAAVAPDKGENNNKKNKWSRLALFTLLNNKMPSLKLTIR